MAENESIDILADRVERLACSKCGHHMDLTGVTPFSQILCPQCETKQVAPMRLGSFLLIAELGKGGMGSVYRAFDETLGRYVAIKVMQKELAADKKFSENFIREARAAAALNHPNVVQIYSCGQEKGQLYIVMELVDGGRLDQMIEGGKALDEAFTLEVGVQVAQGLQAANDIGLIHGDIKPANILFDKQRRAKVVDFGLARFAAQQHSQPGEIWGTPYYIAPEKVRAQKEDQRADIYSLGATLYHVLAGKPPFDGDTAKDVVLARLKNPALSLRSIRPTLQPETADVIARTLEQEPGLRYPTYKSLLADLEEAARVARQRQGLPPKSDAKSSRAPLMIAAIVLLGLGAGAYLVLNEPEPPTPPPRPTVSPGPATDPVDPPATERPVRAEIVYAVQPFPVEAQATIEKAVQQWRDGQPGGYESDMAVLFGSMPRVGVERAWVGVLQALPAWLMRQESDMVRHLRGIQDAQLRELEGDEPHPGAMPQALARYMLGRVSERDVNQVAEEWPAWFGDLTQFFFAITHVRNNDLSGAQRVLTVFVEKESNEADWPYHYQSLARNWISIIEAWLETKKAQGEVEGDRALRALRAHREKVPGWLHNAIDAEIQAVLKRVQNAQTTRAEAERQERERRIKADLDKVEEARQELFPLVQARDFRRASTRVRQQATPLETDEGRAALDLLVDSYDRMESLRRFIITGLQREPLSQAQMPELGGDALGANLSGIRVSLGGHGSMVRNWDQVSERLMASMAEYYIGQMPEEERADMTLSLAIFAYQTRGMRPAQHFAERAIQLDAALGDKAKALMPELTLP